MFSRYLFNSKKENFLDRFFKHLPKLTFFSTIFGFSFLWSYLKHIDKTDFFTRLELSLYGVVSVVIFFIVLFFYFFVNFFVIYIFKSSKGTSYIFNTKEKIFYAITQPILILSFLSITLFLGYSELNSEAKEIAISQFLISIPTVILYIFLFFKVRVNKNISLLIVFSIGSVIIFIYIIGFLNRITEGDREFFIMIIIYISFLMLNNFIVLSYRKAQTSFWKTVFLGFVFICIMPLIGSGVKFQRLILKPIGIAQEPQQSGWYLAKNKDFLNYMIRNYSIKYQKNTDGSENYIYGYLILNVGNVKVICPDDLEDTDRHQDKIDFSQCLTLTSEDIKFMGKKPPFSKPQQ